MSEAKSKKREPLIHISKRDAVPLWQSVGVRVAAIVLSLVVCGIILIFVTKLNPLEVYKAMYQGALGTERRTWVTIRDTLTLLLVGLALVPAFKMRFWNIGGEGQILMGGAATAAVMIYCGNSMPTWLLFVVMIAASMVAGMIWGIIPAVFKAKWNTNETLFTLMLNYVAAQIVNVCITFWENPVGSNTVGLINASTRAGWVGKLFGQQYGWNVLIIAAITVGMFIYMKFSKQGYEIAVVGESENTAKYAGINVKKVIIRTMAISGAIAGLAGFICVSGVDHTITTTTAGGRGFTAIIVAWLAHLNPFTMLIMAFFLTFLGTGSAQIATQFNLNTNMADIITGIILFFILGCEFFVNYKVQFRRKAKKEVQA